MDARTHIETPVADDAKPRDAAATVRRKRLGDFFEALAKDPHRFDLYYTLRRIDAAHPELPPLARASRPLDERARLGQEPSLAFAPSVITGVERDRDVPRIVIQSFGLFGPNGPLPNHLTEYARERLVNNGDATMARFADIFHHRLILLFYRAWADAQSVVSLDRPEDDRFSRHVASLVGIGFRSQKARDAVDDHAKFANAGHLVRAMRNAEGLASILRGYFSMPARIVEYCCRWLVIAPDQRTRLGLRGPGAALGAGAIAGNAVFDGQSSIRVELGPMRLAAYEQFLPGGKSFAQLVAWLRNYVGVELDWRARFVLAKDEVPPPILGQRVRLGWTTWIGRYPQHLDAGDLLLDAERWASRAGPTLNPS